jgi:hypothetical protein
MGKAGQRTPALCQYGAIGGLSAGESNDSDHSDDNNFNSHSRIRPRGKFGT